MDIATPIFILEWICLFKFYLYNMLCGAVEKSCASVMCLLCSLHSSKILLPLHFWNHQFFYSYPKMYTKFLQKNISPMTPYKILVSPKWLIHIFITTKSHIECLPFPLALLPGAVCKGIFFCEKYSFSGSDSTP